MDSDRGRGIVTLKENAMDNTTDKKSNNEQKVNEGFSGENIPQSYNPSGEPLQAESEKDRHGNHDRVMRARNQNEDPQPSGPPADAQPPQHAKQREDFNRDAAGRYPPSHPENHVDRSEP